jgi:hypothetical protein
VIPRAPLADKSVFQRLLLLVLLAVGDFRPSAFLGSFACLRVAEFLVTLAISPAPLSSRVVRARGESSPLELGSAFVITHSGANGATGLSQ